MENNKKRSFLDLINDSLFNGNGPIDLLPFLLFIALIAMFWISNTYYAERNIRDINKLSKEVKELRSEFMSTKLKLMYKSKQSQVADMVDDIGLKESRTPPHKIIITGE